MSKNDGGAAFPSAGVAVPDGRGDMIQQGAYEGMSLRDYFAAAALQGFMANKDRPQNYCPFDDSAYFYRIADAMLAERAK